MRRRTRASDAQVELGRAQVTMHQWLRSLVLAISWLERAESESAVRRRELTPLGSPLPLESWLSSLSLPSRLTLTRSRMHDEHAEREREETQCLLVVASGRQMGRGGERREG